jgi:riboflavin synthase
MFTGIIEAQGLLESIIPSGSNKTFRILSPLSSGLIVDQSLSHNGVCLTVESVSGDAHVVTAIAETLSRTTMDHWKAGDQVNLEQCMRLNDRLDGHIVQGHVDTTAVCVNRENREGSRIFRFEFPESFAQLIIEKGSVAVDGISLTCFDITKNRFSVAIIPYTLEHTNMQSIDAGSAVNIEFDLIGKYVNRISALRSK